MAAMGKLPGGDRAYVDPAKIAGYLLSESHRTGRHKARVFAAALGLRQENSDILTNALLHAAATADASLEADDRYGARYVIEFTMTYSGRSATIISSWIVRTGEDFPRFVTAYVRKQETGNG